METQSYANHRRFVPLFHRVLLPMLLLTVMGSLVNLYESLGDHQRLYSASLIAVLSIGIMMAAVFSRVFALKAQNRAIRAEESLRHFVLTGKLPDSRLTMGQFVALRFAPDGEFVPLAKKAADESLTPDAIKRAIKQWRPDTDRA
jgi:hypothetical protein